MLLLTVLSALVLTAESPEKNDTMKNLMKDAAANEGPDVSKLPFTPDSIKQIVVSYQPRIQGCYEDHISNKKNAPQGKLDTVFIITPEGLVTGAKVKRATKALKSVALHDCVAAVLSMMVFPKPTDGKQHPIEFPFNLKAVD
jgi:hypothetical protein